MSGVIVKRILLVLALTFSMIAPLVARPAATSSLTLRQSPAAAPARTTIARPTSDIASKVLANGLEVVVLEDHSVPIVTIELAVRNGSFTEPPELNGLSHLYEHMFFKANRAIANAEQYLKRLASWGSPITVKPARRLSNTISLPLLQTSARQ
jgi:zinc protease